MPKPTPGTTITPDTKVDTLLDAYPQLEPLLIELAPPFAKLRNPLLRKTVAKITSLRQAAAVGSVDLGVLINRLREAAGQTGDTSHVDADVTKTAGPPVWFDTKKVVDSLDARPILESGQQPLGLMMQRLRRLAPGQIMELTTSFEPAPLIDTARAQGFEAWSTKIEPNLVKTWFRPME